MEAEQHRYELRSGSRSRSQTPSIQSRSMAELAGDLAEHPYDLRSRSRERSHTPSEIGGTRKSMNKLSSASISQSMQSDQSAESPIEAKEENNVGSRIRQTQTQGVKVDDATVLSRKVERRSERQKLKKRQQQQQQQQPPPPSLSSSSSPHLVQMSQLPPVAGKLSNEMQLIHDSNRSSSSPRRIVTSDYSSEEGERENQSSSRPGSAYEIYKQAGDWWNVFPKTDYTYSAASQCRYEIAPGILAMPNMSRRPIHSDDGAGSLASSAASTYGNQDTGSSGIWEQSRERNAHNSMTMSGPADNSCTNFSKEVLLLDQAYTHGKLYRSHQEISYSDDTPTGRAGPRRRAKPQSVQEKFVLASAAVESDTEFEDATIGSKAAVLPKRFGQRFVALLTRLALWFGTLFQLRRHPDTTGRIWSSVYRKMDRHTQYLYLLVVKVLLLDTWLLSRASYVRVHLQERVTKLAWLLIMTPLLLLIGTYILQMPSIVLSSFLLNVTHITTETLHRGFNESSAASLYYYLYDAYLKRVVNLAYFLFNPSFSGNLPWKEVSESELN